MRNDARKYIRDKLEVRCTYCGTGLIFGRHKRQTTFRPSSHGCRPTFLTGRTPRTGVDRLTTAAKYHYPECILAACAALFAGNIYTNYLNTNAPHIQARSQLVGLVSHQRQSVAMAKIAHKLPSHASGTESAPDREHEFLPIIDRHKSLDVARRLFVDAVSPSGADYAKFTTSERPLTGPALGESKPSESRPSEDKGRVLVAGLWGPTAGACSRSEARRLGMLPMRIDERGARAGGVSCSFRETTVTSSNSWAVVAQCRSGRERWTSNVRLALSGSRLTWSSERGSQGYVRCDRTMVASR